MHYDLIASEIGYRAFSTSKRIQPSAAAVASHMQLREAAVITAHYAARPSAASCSLDRIERRQTYEPRRTVSSTLPPSLSSAGNKNGVLRYRRRRERPHRTGGEHRSADDTETPKREATTTASASFDDATHKHSRSGSTSAFRSVKGGPPHAKMDCLEQSPPNSM